MPQSPAGPGLRDFLFLISSFEDANNLFPGCLSRVGKLAYILHGVLCHDAEVFLLDTQLAQVLRDSDLLGNLADGSNGFSCSVHGGETVNVLARGLCDIAEAVCVADQVEFLYMGQQDRVADAVGQVVEAA